MDFDKICKIFTMQEPYYGIILSSMEKYSDPKFPFPAAVSRNGNVFRLTYNPTNFENYDVPTTIEVLKHEIMHVCFDHFGLWDYRNVSEDIQKVRNVAADLEVNSYINRNNVHNLELLYADMFGWENELGAKEYYKRLMEEAEKKQQECAAQNPQNPCNGGGGETGEPENDSQTPNQQNNPKNPSNGKRDLEQKEDTQSLQEGGQGQDGEGQGGGGSQWGFGDEHLPQEFLDSLKEFDDHSKWPEGKEAEVSEQIVEDLLLQAADEVEKGRGTIPGCLRARIEDIRKKRKPRPVADWKRYVRRYLGNEFSEFIRKSKKRESRRFPDAAGNRHRRKSHILVGIDTSGSVSMPEYIEFFGQIKTLTAVADFDVIECDAEIQYMYPFKRNPNMDVHGGGGTAFEPVVDYFIAHNKKYDALIYFTDGECYVPDNTPKDTLWVISSRGDRNRRAEFQKNGAKVVYIKPNQ